ACACHAADMAFEYCYQPDFPRAVRMFSRHGGPAGFLAHFSASHKKREGKLIETINVVAMAAASSPDAAPTPGLAFPLDIPTRAPRPDVWARWLAHDPVYMVDDAANRRALSGLRLLFLDAGTRDEYALDIGARILAAKLRAHGVPHTHEEFDDGHMNITW